MHRGMAEWTKDAGMLKKYEKLKRYIDKKFGGGQDNNNVKLLKNVLTPLRTGCYTLDESGRNSQKGPAALLWVVKSMKQNAHIQHAGRSRRRNGLVATGLVFALMLAILMCYSNYIQAQIKSECTKNLLETYEQVDKTFLMFAQRNWNVLSDWNGRLQHLAKSGEMEEKWQDIVLEKETWQFSDFYLFNEDCDYATVNGRRGNAENARKAFEALYDQNGQPVVSSYIATSGIRKVVFELGIDPVVLNGITYTGLAVSYDNNVLENIMGSGAYNGQSDCYIIYPDGEVLMSTEPKSEIPTQLENLFDFLTANAAVNNAFFEQMQDEVRTGGKGSVTYRYQNKDYYLVHQPVGIRDWQIVGIVDQTVIESGMRKVQYTTILLLFLVACCIMLGGVQMVQHSAKVRLREETAARESITHQKELSDQLFNGISRIVDRFAVCDLKNNTYEYHEQKKAPLYPENGTYQELLRWVDCRYRVLNENGKTGQVMMSWMISPQNLREKLKKDDDSFRFEYCTQDGTEFMVMSAIPVVWKGSELMQVMLISQDTEWQHELENLANTDGLTGLYNGRYFSSLLRQQQEKEQEFVLFYLDLDRFKPVNDTYGHDMGDKLLQAVAQRLRTCIRDEDYAFRIGGDEFALVVTGHLSEELVQARVEKIRETILQPVELDGLELRVGTSCGWAAYPAESASCEEIRVLADQRMYEDKERNHAERT